MAITETADVKVGQGNRSDHFDTRRSGAKQTGVVGLCLGVIYAVGFVWVFPTPNYDDTDAQWTEWVADSGNRASAISGAALFVLAGLAMLWFTSLLVAEVRRRRGDFGPADSLAFASGSAAAVIAIVGAIIGTATSIALTLAPGVDVVPSAEMLKWLELAGTILILIGAGWCQAVFLAAISYAARTTNILPKWLTTAGFVGAVVLLGSWAYIPNLAFPLWVLAASVTLMRTSDATV